MRARKWAGTVSSLERRAAGPATKRLHPELQAFHLPAMPAAFLGRSLTLSGQKRSFPWPGFPVERPFLWRGFRVAGPALREDRDKDKDEDEKPAKRLPSDDPSQVPLGVLADCVTRPFRSLMRASNPPRAPALRTQTAALALLQCAVIRESPAQSHSELFRPCKHVCAGKVE